MPIMITTPAPPRPNPYCGIDAETFDEVKAALASLPPTSDREWGCERVIPSQGYLHVVRLCDAGVAVVTTDKGPGGVTRRHVCWTFLQWSAITSASIRGRDRVVDLSLHGPGSGVSIMLDADDPAAGALMAGIFAAKGWA